jgi:hypothetical protein
MLSEQKSRRKSSVEIEVYPYKSLTTPYFLSRFPQRFLAAGNKLLLLYGFTRNGFYLDEPLIR